MGRLKSLLPDALAARIVLLLAIAIFAANLVALLVLNFQQQRVTQAAREEREIERIATLIPGMEAVDARVRQMIARDASTRFARIRVEDTPLLSETASDSRSKSIAEGLAETLGRDDVSVAILDRSTRSPSNNRPNRFGTDRVIAVTIPLSARQGRVEWLNVVTSGAAPRRHTNGRPFLTLLVLSLFSVLGVGMLVARRLTKPLAHLSKAARAAGRGDRTARVPEEGPREMREAARAFNAMQTEISQFDAERLRMLAAVGHDLRTPMTSLRIRAEMLDADDQRNAMIRTLDEMTVMADSLVSYAKEGQDSEPMDRLDLGPLLTQICEDRSATCNITTGAQVVARRVGLSRAIGNLIDNALRYGTDALVSLALDNQHAVVTIDDSGPGIPLDRVKDMFQPFTRGESSRSTDTGGAGLGLSIARTIVISHGGWIELENRAKGGLRATVVLPLA